MEISSVLIVLILSIGLVQGLIFGIVLFKSKSPNQVSNRILGIILLLLSYRLLVQIMRLFGLGYYDTWYYFMVEMNWAYGALIYFYAKSKTQANFKFTKQDWLHFIPVAIQVCFSVFVRLQNLYWDGTRDSLSWLGYYGYVIWMNNSTIYVIASMLIILYTYRALQLFKSPRLTRAQMLKLVWVKRIIRSFLLYFSFVLLILIADLLIHQLATGSSYYYFTRFYYYPFFVGIAGLTYWIGLEGFSRRNEPTISTPQPSIAQDLEKLRSISTQLKLAMEEEKLYKNPNLSLNSLANHLGIKPYLISKSLSEVYGKRFNDYINEYRVKEVQTLLQDPSNARYTLLSLAMDAGFNSKSSFNRAVKKHLGITPNQLK